MPPATPSVRSRPHGILMALALVVVYIALAAGLGNFLSGLVGDDQPTVQFALGHLVPLPIGLAVLLLYVRWTGQTAQVWRERPTPTLRPRRWYLVAIPVLIVATSAAGLTEVPWADRAFGTIAIITLGTLLVGFGEELAVRGVLLTAVRERHGEFLTLVVTSFVFALAHIPGAFVSGTPIALIAFEMGAFIFAGVGFYWVRRVTGRLWVGALVHAFGDWVLYLAAPDINSQAASMPHGHEPADTPFIQTFQILLWLVVAVSIISVIREDRRNKKRALTETNDAASAPPLTP